MPDEDVPTPKLAPVIRIVTASKKTWAGTDRDLFDLLDTGVSN